MRLNDSEFKRLKELKSKKDLTDAEKSELAELQAKKANNAKGKDGKFCFKPGNDFSWWSKVPVLLKDAVNLPLNWVPGTALVPGTLTQNGKPGAPSSVLRVDLQNVYGSEESASGPLNLAARNLYLAMHRKYRGLNAYQAADIAIVIAATIELFILIARIERIYGVINYYAIDDRRLPYALLNAMGISYTLADNIRDNLSDFRYGINNLIRRAQNVCIPKDLSVLLNKIALYGYVYKDHDDVKAQAIVFDCKETGIYIGDLTDTGGGVAYVDTSFSGASSYTTIIDKLNIAVSALVEDSDVLRIYSDFLSYLDPTQFMTLVPLPEEYFVVPVYSEEILHKLHNAYSTGAYYYIDDQGENFNFEDFTEVKEMSPNGLTFKTGYSASDGVRKIVQKDNVVYTRLCLFSTGSGGSWTSFSTGILDGYTAFQWDSEEVVPSCSINGAQQVFDTYRHEADPATMLEGCLFKFTPATTQRVHYVTSCAWEIVNKFTQMVVIDGQVASSGDVHQYIYWSGYDSNMSMATVRQMKDGFISSIGLAMQYDWAPILYNVIDDDIGECYFKNTLPFIGDVCNCRLVDYNDIYRMHEVAVYSGLETSAALTKD